MTTTSVRRKSPFSQETHAVLLTAEWLRNREYVVPTTTRSATKALYPHVSGLYRSRLPRDWQLLQEQRLEVATTPRPDMHQKLRTGFLALQAAVHAREAMVYNAVMHDKDLFTANELSWAALSAYARSVVDGRVAVPAASRLAQPIDEAISTYTGHEYGNPVHTFIGMVGLSSVVVADFYSKSQEQMIIPNPGAQLATLHAWDYEPASLPVPMGLRP